MRYFLLAGCAVLILGFMSFQAISGNVIIPKDSGSGVKTSLPNLGLSSNPGAAAQLKEDTQESAYQKRVRKLIEIRKKKNREKD